MSATPGRIPDPETLAREGCNTPAAGWFETELARLQIEHALLRDALRDMANSYNALLKLTNSGGPSFALILDRARAALAQAEGEK